MKYGKYTGGFSLEPHYSEHVFALTAEKLNAKSEIAVELAVRDARIAELEKERDEARLVRNEANAEMIDARQRYAQLRVSSDEAQAALIAERDAAHAAISTRPVKITIGNSVICFYPASVVANGWQPYDQPDSRSYIAHGFEECERIDVGGGAQLIVYPPSAKSEFVCSCAKRCRNRAEMRVTHGAPEQFNEAVFRAIGEISVKEADAAVAKYAREWAAAPEVTP